MLDTKAGKKPTHEWCIVPKEMPKNDTSYFIIRSIFMGKDADGKDSNRKLADGGMI